MPERGGEGCFLRLPAKLLLLAGLVALIFCAGRDAFCLGLPSGATTARSEGSSPINVTGHETIYDSRDDTFTVIGDAVMTQGGSILKADQIKLFRKQRTAVATGHVHLIDPDVEMWATEAKLDLANETLKMDNAQIRAKNTTYRIEGQKIVKLQGQDYEVTKGFFTTCGCAKEKGAPDWSITGDQMDVNVGQTGTAKGASFNILGYQPFKVPSLTFPANTDRHSGLLSGRQGQSGLRGFQLLQPYYWAISKTQDATVAFDIETRQRVGGLAEYRLVNGPDDYFWIDGAFYDESLRTQANRQGDIIDTQTNDPFIPLNRYGVIGMAREHITDNLMVYGDAVTVSDNYYLREMDQWTLSSGFGSNWGSMRDAISHWGILDEFNNGFGQVQGTWHQDLIQANQFALQELPKAWISGRQDLGGIAFLDYDAQATNFYREEGQYGGRAFLDPKLTIPWRLGDYLYGYGAVGVEANIYDTAGNTINVTPVGQPFSGLPVKASGAPGVLQYNNGLSVGPIAPGGVRGAGIPYMSTGVASEIERVWDINGTLIEKLKNTIEPFASYAYVPRIYQGNLPLFDQYDRVNARSLFTYGVTTRLFAKVAPQSSDVPPETETDASTGLPSVNNSPLDFSPTEAAFPAGGAAAFSRGEEIRELAQLTLMQAYDVSHDLGPYGDHISDLQANLTVYPTTIAALGSQVDYNPRNHAGVTFANVYFTIQPPWSKVSNVYMGKALQGSFLQASYNYVNPQTAVLPTTTANASQFATIRAYTDIGDMIGIYVSPLYNFSTAQLDNAQYGLRLKSPCDCWAADGVITDSFNPNEVQFQFQLTLGGLGSIGQSPFGRNPFQTIGLAGNPMGAMPVRP